MGRASRKRIASLAAWAMLLVVLGVVGWLLLSGVETDGAVVPSADDAISEAAPTEELVEVALSGLVVERRSSKGIAGAEVSAVCDVLGDDEPRTTRADDSGHFAFRWLPDGTCHLRATALGFTPGGPVSAASIEVIIREGHPLEGVKIPLFRSAILGGVVVAGDEPVEGASLSVLYTEAPGEPGAFSVSPDTMTDADGHFAILALGPGRVQVLVEKEEYALAESEEIFLRAGDRVTNLVIRLAGGGDVVGRVVDRDGRAIRDAKVTLASHGARGVRRTTTGRRGGFTFEGVAPGSATLIARATGYVDGRLRDVAVTAGEAIEVTVTLAAQAGFGGIVLSPAGEPVKGAAVYVVPRGARLPSGHVPLPPRAYSGEDGRFWISKLPSGPSECYATHPKFGPSGRVDIPRDGGDLELRLTTGGRLVGRVIDADGEPVTSYMIVLQGFRPQGGGRPQRGGLPRAQVRDSSGSFAFDGLAPGVYDVRVAAPGYPPVVSSGHEVVAGGETDTGPITLARGGAVTGLVTDADTGEPIPGAFVRAAIIAAPGFSGGGPRAVTDEDGAFRMEGLPGERLSVHIRARGYITRMASGVEVPEAGEVDLGTLSLTPADAAGRGQMQYSGIGAVLSRRGGSIVIRQAFDGAPASEMGLEDGTEIRSINGYDVGDMDLRQAVELIRGETGSEVTLEVVRPGDTYPETVRVERGDVTTPPRGRFFRR